MTSLSDYLKQEFSTQREQWLQQLQQELKLPDVSSKISKPLGDGGAWPTLALEAKEEGLLPVTQSWKKAAQTYALIPSNISDLVIEDLTQGVRNFFFYKEFLNQDQWNQIEKIFLGFAKKDELDIILLGSKKIASLIPVIHESDMATGREAEHQGGSIVQELALMTKNLIQDLKDTPVVTIGVFMDSQFFKNIAKIRAAKLLAYKVLQSAQVTAKVHVIALTSYREWTLYERYSNMLRNDVAVASAFIGGADSVQSSGYQMIFDLETGKEDPEHAEKSRRMARNTSHILALESMLGVVEDPAYGSYHVENLSHHFASQAWDLMRQASAEDIIKATEQVRNSRLSLLKTRKTILAGINDYPDVNEILNIHPVGRFFRLARPFEILRLQMAASVTQPKVHIALYGNYAALNARVNFVRNYFELLGLTVNDPAHNTHDMSAFISDVQNRPEEILVLCASDENYPEIAAQVQTLKTPEKFLAGRTEIPGFTSLHAGQDVYAVLEALVKRWSRS